MKEGYPPHLRISDWFKRRKPKQSTAEPETDLENVLNPEIQGVVTDQKLLIWYYKTFKQRDVQPVATDRFMHRSRAEYNEAFLARELVQNFVDENEEHPYTLDGVAIKRKKVDRRRGTIRSIIRGNWKFEDPTGLTTLHSAKTEIRRTAGGNGIGLKQVVLRFLRDFGVQIFQIQGEGWTVSYHLAKKEEINKDLQTKGYSVQLLHDWLIADIQHSDNHGSCSYIIETNSTAVIRALQELPNLGVSESNKFLKNPDFKNEKGALKWLPIIGGNEEAQGRLFINGQVMNYKSKGKTSENYWKGPELVTIRLDDVDYAMSMDRPPINAYDLNGHIAEFIQSMSEDELLEQLRKSEHIWSEVFDTYSGSDRKGCFVVIEAIVRNLSRSPTYDKNSFAAHFGKKKYLCWDYGVTAHQIKDLEKQGFVICPPYFERIGMEKASSKLDSLEIASNEKPKSPRYKLEKIAEEYGLVVACERIEVKDPAEFLRSLKERLAKHTVKIETCEERPNTFRIHLDVKLPNDLLFHQLPLPKTEQQKLLHYLRSVVFMALEQKFFENAFTSSGEYITTFSTQYDPVMEENNLLARNIKCNSDQGVFVEFELSQELADTLKAIFSGNLPNQEGRPTTNIIEEKKQTTRLQIDVKTEVPVTKDTPAGISEVRRKLEKIPVQQPKLPVIPERKKRTVIKQIELSREEQTRLTELEEKIPEIAEAIAVLESAAPATRIGEKKEGAPDKYVEWRNSPNFYGQATQAAQYLTGRHLLEIVAESSHADIPNALSDREMTGTEIKMAHLNATLKRLANRFAPPEDEVDDFEIVLVPTEQQLAKIGILRAYTHLTTKVALPNDVFVFIGTGSKGVNIAQKAIGLHASLFCTDFKEALGTMTHEMAHNASMSHDIEFMHTMEALFTTMNDELSRISEKLLRKEELTEDERMVLELKRKWNELE